MQRSLGWPLLALASIWMAVAIVSIAGADVVFGADSTTFPLVPLVTWIWGAVASTYVLAALVRRRSTVADQRHAWIGMATTSLIIWGVVVILSLVIPEFTFTLFDDPVVLPLGSLLAPAAGVVATAIAAQYVPGLTDVAYTNPPPE